LLNDELQQLRALEPDLASLVHLAEAAEVLDRGPFRALLSPTTEWANLVMPVSNSSSPTEVTDALAALGQRFAAAGRTPRLLFKEPFFPGLPELLAGAGLLPSEREPLMICSPVRFRPAVRPDVSVRFLRATDDDEDLAAYQTIWSQSLRDGSWQPTSEALAAFRTEIEHYQRGGAAIATLNGERAGTGFLVFHGSGCEVMRVATAPAARRRGVGSAMSSFLVEHGFAGGATIAWLAAASAEARSLYEQIGFRYVGDELTYLLV
jgi:ribosomal protein S18 acetylase RimI-like enzyme